MPSDLGKLGCRVPTDFVITLESIRKEIKKMAGNPECKKDGHKMHMCSIKAEELDQTDAEKYKQLTENPKYECGNCGAKVNSSENVCDPVEL